MILTKVYEGNMLKFAKDMHSKGLMAEPGPHRVAVDEISVRVNRSMVKYLCPLMPKCCYIAQYLDYLLIYYPSALFKLLY